MDATILLIDNKFYSRDHVSLPHTSSETTFPHPEFIDISSLSR
jgi:hypothetical protein